MVTGDSLSPIRGLFVFGAARSGTTVVGNYLGSSPEVLNLGEYGGFWVAYALERQNSRENIVRRGNLGLTETDHYSELFRQQVIRHAHQFVERIAADRDRRWYCDSTPWNVSIADRLAENTRGSIFVLLLRHYSGTIQSLRRSYAGGFSWAGKTWADSARVWADAYASVGSLPIDRTIPLSYEALTEEPERTLQMLRSRLEGMGFDASAVDEHQLAISHAPPVGAFPRRTIGTETDSGVRLGPIQSFEPEAWSGDIQATVWPIVRDVHLRLREFFPEYRSPVPPRDLRVHDDVQGLMTQTTSEW